MEEIREDFTEEADPGTYGVLEAAMVVRSLGFAVSSNPTSVHLNSPVIKGRSLDRWEHLSSPLTWRW